MKNRSDFTVCVLAKESPEIVDRFIKFYLAAGASKILLYLDRGSPEIIQYDQDAVVVTTCDELLGFLGLESRPEFITDLQVLVYRHAYDSLETEWMLICDIDEYVYSDQGIQQSLANVQSNWDFLRLEVAEAIWAQDDDLEEAFGSSLFRLRAPEGYGRLQSFFVHGTLHKYLSAGLVGHSQGKCFVRKGIDGVSLGIHRPYHKERELQGGTLGDLINDNSLLLHHFDAINFQRWDLKQSGRADRSRASRTHNFNRPTDLAFQKFKSCQSSKERRALFKRLYQVNKTQEKMLRFFKRLRKVDIFKDR